MENVNETGNTEKPDLKKILLENIKNLEEKKSNMYFFVMDTKGNATAGMANIYKHVKTLIELGYNAKLLHEKTEFTSVESWLGKEYSELPHVSIEEQQLKVKS